MSDIQLVIAIDGPASSGKSVLGEALAHSLGYLYFDTGALYRAVTWLALHTNVDVADDFQVSRLARNSSIIVCKPTVDDGRQYTVEVDGQDITWEIVKPNVEANVSVVAALPAVREALLHLQRTIASTGGVVMVGRDIGTVVVPTADLKIYLDATPQVRAQRRYKQAIERGQKVDYESILENVLMRDRIDSGRTAAPLKPAEDAVVVDTSHMSFDEELTLVKKLVEDRQSSRCSNNQQGDKP